MHLNLFRLSLEHLTILTVCCPASVGGHSQTGLPVASAGPTGSGGHARAKRAQRVSAAQHPACTRRSPFSGQEQERRRE